MKCIFFLVIGIQLSFSQIYEVGIVYGGSNFIGDVGSTDFISPSDPVIGSILKWNRSPRHSFRFSLLSTNLHVKDRKSSDPRRIERDLNFSSKLLEISTGMEFTFFDFNLHDYENKFTPYLFSGIIYTRYDDLVYNGNTINNSGKTNWSYGIPFIIGGKYSFMDNFIFSVEVGSKYVFSDNIDSSHPNEDNFMFFGNQSNNDWYIFSLVNLSYTFGKKPCYCNF